MKDTFEAVNKIRSIPPELFEQGYRYYSLYVVSPFTNVPLNRTIKIILKRVYEEKLLATKLRRNTLKKLIKDTCIKTAFSCNNNFFVTTFCLAKDKSKIPQKANIIYDIQCPACKEHYIGKTDRCFVLLLDEHGS